MKLSGKNLLVLTLALVALVWAFAVPAIAAIYTPVLPYGGAAAFGVAAAVVADVYLALFSQPSDIRRTEAEMLPQIFTVGYVAASLVVNTGFILMQYGSINKWMVAANLFLLAAYTVLVLYSERSAQHLLERMEKNEQKIVTHSDISAKVGRVLALAEDAESRQKLVALKEMVDYNSNVSTTSTEDAEDQMEDRLDELLTLLREGADRAAIQKKIQEAESCWKVRCNAAAGR